MNHVTVWFGDSPTKLDANNLQICLSAKQASSQTAESQGHKLSLHSKLRHAYPVSSLNRQAIQAFIEDHVAPSSSVVMMAASERVDHVAMALAATTLLSLQCRCQAIILQSTLPQPSSGLTSLRQLLTMAFLRSVECPIALAAVEQDMLGLLTTAVHDYHNTSLYQPPLSYLSLHPSVTACNKEIRRQTSAHHFEVDCIIVLSPSEVDQRSLLSNLKLTSTARVQLQTTGTSKKLLTFLHHQGVGADLLAITADLRAMLKRGAFQAWLDSDMTQCDIECCLMTLEKRLN
eukprot:m.41475 g.41475  ORF g.41475 m.41475 type:complete len:289 (+) comp12835_c0_seq1:109-975(+)